MRQPAAVKAQLEILLETILPHAMPATRDAGLSPNPGPDDDAESLLLQRPHRARAAA